MRFARLLAKSEKEKAYGLLPRHLYDVWEAAEVVLSSTLQHQLEMFGLPYARYAERTRRIILTAAILHDLGKANDHFQEMVRGQRSLQGLRHEWVTLLILEDVQLSSWIHSQLLHPVVDWQIVLWAIAGHHPAYNRPSPPLARKEAVGRNLQILSDHNDFALCLEQVAQALQLPAFSTPLEARTVSLLETDGLFQRFMDWEEESQDAFRAWEPQIQGLAALCKAALIAADIAGSALPPHFDETASRQLWIAQGFQRRASREELLRIVDRRRKGQELREFQKEMGASSARTTFVRAGCGSGKTLGAYFWAAQQHAGRPLYFCYPTTGTATEGYRDYLYAPEEEFAAELFHGRQAVDVEILGLDEQDSREEYLRVESLVAWSTPIVSCTVDTVLGLIQNQRRGLYAWPALAQAAYIFDEIHSYDERLFGALLRFLESLPGTPSLLMTASLSQERLQAIRRVAQSRGEVLNEISGPEELETRPRYRQENCISLQELTTTEFLRHKTLWVCNTVSEALEVAERLQEFNPLLYHSRFKYKDRVQRHKALIDAFRQPGPVLAITTQVAEMSLDISATLLVTQLCPIWAMIQRLGRLNRLLQFPSCPFLVYEPKQPRPYSEIELAQAREWLQTLPTTELSQRDLVTAWKYPSPGGDRSRLFSSWLDGGPRTEVVSLRESSPAITVLLESDYRRLGQETHGRAKFSLPMNVPKGQAWKSWKRDKGLVIVPDSMLDYCELKGGVWRN